MSKTHCEYILMTGMVCK